MNSRNFLFFTTNYPFAKLELMFLGGEILHKVSEHIFIASLPISVSKRQLSYSTLEKPDPLDLEENELHILENWNSWEQDFLTL